MVAQIIRINIQAKLPERSTILREQNGYGMDCWALAGNDLVGLFFFKLLVSRVLFHVQVGSF